MVSTSIICIRHRLLFPCRRVPQREAGAVWGVAARLFHNKGPKMRRLPALACRRRHDIPQRGFSSGARKILAVAILTTQLILSQTRYALAAGDDAVEVSWEFDDSADGWAKTTPIQMDAEVQWKPAGVIRGTVRGPSPRVDSPSFRVLANDRHHVAMRMRSSGAATVGRLALRAGRVPGEADHGLNPWTTSGDVIVLQEQSSSGGNNATLAADGDLTTVWEASGSTNEWVTLDLGEAREVAGVRLQAPGGDSNPRNIRLQRGPSPGGKFSTVANLTLGNSSDSEDFTVPPSRGRFWRLYVLDGHGGNRTSLREVELLGPADTTLTEPLDFEVFNDNIFHLYHVPIFRSFQGVLTQLRLWPGVETAGVPGRQNASLAPNRGDAFEIDWIRIVRAPHVKLVQGCIDLAYLWPDTPEVGRDFASSNITARNDMINGFLELGRTWFGTVEGGEYGTTKSCLVGGGEAITITGAAFGRANAQVNIDGSPCLDVVHTPGREETELTCVSPPATVATNAKIAAAAAAAATAVEASGDNSTSASYYKEWSSTIEVMNGKMPGLRHGVEYVSYQAPPPPIRKPFPSNVAARSVDVSWEPPADYWLALAITGYEVGWRTVESGLASLNDSGVENALGAGEDEVEHSMVVGNVTTTTVRGLVSGTQHAFWVRGLSENRSDPAVVQVDLYGRRDPLQGAVTGIFGEVSDVVTTLGDDIIFERFDANLTLNHSTRSATSTVGPRGQWSGEGHYGLQLVGTSQVENCNRSASCCDGFDETTGSCGSEGEGSQYFCAASATPGQIWALDTGDPLLQTPISGDPSSSSSSSLEARLPSSAVVVSRESALRQGWGSGVSQACGPALRLTASRPASAGAAWYPRQITVGEGFDTRFTFRLSSPSLRCNSMDGVHTHCRSRGADGVAFVVQGDSSTALGKGGLGMGYAGISNALAVEFDTHYNPDLLEPYQNHVSVQTRGWRDSGSPHGLYSLGSTPNVPDLTSGEVTVRLVYTPIVTPGQVFHPAFQATRHAAHFLTNGDFHEGGLGDWGKGIGTLSVYVGNLHEPCLVVPINLEETLHLHHGRAFVGFTAATGRDTWQVHDVLRWSFSSLRQDTPNWPPPVVNGYQNGFATEAANLSCTGKGAIPCADS